MSTFPTIDDIIVMIKKADSDNATDRAAGDAGRARLVRRRACWAGLAARRRPRAWIGIVADDGSVVGGANDILAIGALVGADRPLAEDARDAAGLACAKDTLSDLVRHAFGADVV